MLHPFHISHHSLLLSFSILLEGVFLLLFAVTAWHRATRVVNPFPLSLPLLSVVVQDLNARYVFPLRYVAIFFLLPSFAYNAYSVLYYDSHQISFLCCPRILIVVFR